MINGLYSASSGMLTQQIRLDVVASNIANANVPGFKGERIVFNSFPDRQRIEADIPGAEPREIGALGGGVAVSEVTTNHAPGQTVRTGQDTDFAIIGEGFMHVQTLQGERLTRNGSFMQDAEGYIRNADGYYLLGDQGPIQIVESSFEVSASGEVFVQRDTATPDGRRVSNRVKVDQLKLSRLQNPEQLEREGNSLYFQPDLVSLAEDEEIVVGQGYLEMSNVKAIEESVHLIDTFRAYESAQRIVLAIDGTLDQAINQVGRG